MSDDSERADATAPRRSSSESAVEVGRRAFLGGAGIAGAAVALSPVTTAVAQDKPAAQPASATQATPSGYTYLKPAEAAFVEAICREPFEYQPRSKAVYSDLGFMLLGLWLEKAGGAPLEVQAHALYDRLQLRSLHFRPLGARGLRQGPIAATGLLRPREPAAGQEALFEAGSRKELHPGEVDDDNAFAPSGYVTQASFVQSLTAVLIAVQSYQLNQVRAPAPWLCVAVCVCVCECVCVCACLCVCVCTNWGR